MTQQRVTCEKCQHEFELQSGLQARPVGKDVQQIAVVCPNCNEAKHAYFETPDIAAARQRLNTAAQRFQEAQPADKEKLDVAIVYLEGGYTPPEDNNPPPVVTCIPTAVYFTVSNPAIPA